MTIVAYGSVRDARTHFKDLLDAADEGRPAVVSRDDRRVAALDADRLVHFLLTVLPAKAQVVSEAGGWSIMLPGLPIAADGATLDEAVDEMVEAMRDYADDWVGHLRSAPNHRENWGLVQAISLASDDDLRGWLTA